MKRRILGILLTMVMTAGLMTGCGSGGQEDNTAPASDASEQDHTGDGNESANQESSGKNKSSGKAVEITWLHHFQEEGIKVWVEDMIQSFEAENPDIHINVETVPYNTYDQTLKTKIASDDAPMIFDLAGQVYYEEYAKAGHLYDVTQIEGLENIDESYLPDGQVDGKQYAVPLDVNGYAIFYNKAIFDKYQLKVPTTLTELKEICEILTGNGVQPFAAPMQELWGLQEYVDVAGFPVFGTPDWFTDKMNLTSHFADDEKFKEAIKNYYSFKPYWGDDPFGTNWDTAQNMVATGEAAMVANGSWAIDGITAKNPDCDVRVFAMPTTDDPSGAVMILRPGNGICLYNSTDTDKLEAGKKFYSWLLSKKSGESYATNGFKISTAKGVDLSFSDGLMDIQSYPAEQVWNSSGLTLFSDEYYQIFYETILNYSMEDEMDVDGLAESLDNDFASIRN